MRIENGKSKAEPWQAQLRVTRLEIVSQLHLSRKNIAIS
jgi:hypothetical protein